jgi:RimJ/RimL family protein N-acetyltransferase
VWRNLFDGFPHPYTRADAEAWCGGGARAPAVGLVWGIEVDGAIVGCIGLVPERGWLRCNAEVGYWIGEALWGRGIVADALARVVDWGFSNLPELTRMVAPIFAWNEPSMAVARKCGFVKEGSLPRSCIKDGQVIDRVQYAIYRPAVRSDAPA